MIMIPNRKMFDHHHEKETDYEVIRNIKPQGFKTVFSRYCQHLNPSALKTPDTQGQLSMYQ